MVAVIDYGVGNLFSLSCSLNKIGAEAVITSDAAVIRKADKILLPGVGAFEDAMNKLKNSGLDKIIINEVKKGKPLLGICLGMQLLFDKSYEYGEHKGLGLIKGDIVPIKDVVTRDAKIPHIGWNKLLLKGEKNELFKYINDGDYVYFVHSYYADNCKQNTIATTDYYQELTASVANENVYGCQFHPEKSGKTGLDILKAFCEMKG